MYLFTQLTPSACNLYLQFTKQWAFWRDSHILSKHHFTTSDEMMTLYTYGSLWLTVKRIYQKKSIKVVDSEYGLLTILKKTNREKTSNLKNENSPMGCCLKGGDLKKNILITKGCRGGKCVGDWYIISSWWLNQPIWKICLSNWIISRNRDENKIYSWLVVSTQLKIISQIGNLPQIGVKIKDIWNHHPAFDLPPPRYPLCPLLSSRIFSWFNPSVHTCVMTLNPRPAHVNLQTVGHGTSKSGGKQLSHAWKHGKWLHETALENEDFCWTPKMEGLEHDCSGFQFSDC